MVSNTYIVENKDLLTPAVPCGTMVDRKYPAKSPSRVTRVGVQSTYIRVPFSLIETKRFPYKVGDAVVVTVESSKRVVITPLK